MSSVAGFFTPNAAIMPTAAFSHPVFVVPIPSPPFVLLDDATAGPGVTASRLYTDFVREDVLEAGADVSALDTLLASGWRDGRI